MTRVLLTYEQVRAYGLPATEGRSGDPRWPAFARRYGLDPRRRPVQWEVEALEPDELQRLVLAAVECCVLLCRSAGYDDRRPDLVDGQLAFQVVAGGFGGL
ncbi:hypothetical protein EDD96_0086 [Streptomyces sp. Ag109_G2-6]|nr:hypothetical protein EDD96_0086 [Streptomyces sp. Ag109_G2-6]